MNGVDIERRTGSTGRVPRRLVVFMDIRRYEKETGEHSTRSQGEYRVDGLLSHTVLYFMKVLDGCFLIVSCRVSVVSRVKNRYFFVSRIEMVDDHGCLCPVS